MTACIETIQRLADASHSVLERVLTLNETYVTKLSALDAPSLHRLIETAFSASVINGGDAFVISFDQDADYDSPNFRWFRSRYARFVYVDRIAVATDAQGRGHARRLYDSLFAEAAARHHSLITCEVNVDPPNRASDSFHEALGFEEVGRATLPNGKTVRYLAKHLQR